jgi:hypothetical protein
MLTIQLRPGGCFGVAKARENNSAYSYDDSCDTSGLVLHHERKNRSDDGNDHKEHQTGHRPHDGRADNAEYQ